jgi:hypothetical protein
MVRKITTIRKGKPNLIKFSTFFHKNFVLRRSMFRVMKRFDTSIFKLYLEQLISNLSILHLSLDSSLYTVIPYCGIIPKMKIHASVRVKIKWNKPRLRRKYPIFSYSNVLTLSKSNSLSPNSFPSSLLSVQIWFTD